jgi:hypothetical protein
VGGGVGRVVVGAEISLDLHHAAGEKAGIGLVNQELAQKPGRDAFRTVLVEPPFQEPPVAGHCGKARRLATTL